MRNLVVKCPNCLALNQFIFVGARLCGTCMASLEVYENGSCRLWGQKEVHPSPQLGIHFDREGKAP